MSTTPDGRDRSSAESTYDLDGASGDARFGRVVGAFGLAALALLAAWAAIYLSWPFGQDQSAFAWVADAILRGGLPYRDAWEVKGPLDRKSVV